MKIINKAILLLLVSLTGASLFAQSGLSFGYRKPEAAIDTFVQKIEEAGRLSATIQSADGGFVTLSRIDDSSALVRKIKASGQKDWERIFHFEVDNRFFNPSSGANGITQTTDGGYILAGEMGCDYRCWDHGSPMLIKLRPNGTVVWKKRFEVDGVGSSIFTSATPMSDGGVIATGVFLTAEVGSRFLIVRVTAQGDVVWKRSFQAFPDANVFSAHPIVSTSSGLILAYTTINDFYKPNGVDVMKITNTGNIVWRKSLKAEGFVFKSIGVSQDSGIILVGSGKNSNKLNVIALKADGKPVWEQRYSPEVPGIIQTVSNPSLTSDGGFVVTGGTYDKSTMKSYGFLMKIDSLRRVVFQNSLGSGHEYSHSVFNSKEGGFIVFGNMESGIFISKTNSKGIVPGCNFFDSAGTTPPISYNSVHVAGVKIVPSGELHMKGFDFSVSSVVAHQTATALCQ